LYKITQFFGTDPTLNNDENQYTERSHLAKNNITSKLILKMHS